MVPGTTSSARTAMRVVIFSTSLRISFLPFTTPNGRVMVSGVELRKPRLDGMKFRA